MLGVVCPIALTINKVSAARLNAGETGKFYLEPGEAVLTVEKTDSCALPGEHGATLTVNLRKDDRKNFRIWRKPGQLIGIETSDM